MAIECQSIALEGRAGADLEQRVERPGGSESFIPGMMDGQEDEAEADDIFLGDTPPLGEGPGEGQGEGSAVSPPAL